MPGGTTRPRVGRFDSAPVTMNRNMQWLALVAVVVVDVALLLVPS